jgi:CHAT domain-containing protein
LDFGYSNADSLGKAEALRAAQLKMLNQQRAQSVEPRPTAWGAFVLSGNWN